MGLSNIINTIFGGSNSKNKSEAGNLAYPFIQDNFGASGAGAYNNALGSMQGVLGSGPQGFWDQGGGDFLMKQGLDGLTSKFSSLGLTRSGAAMKGMEQFRHGLASTYLDNWLGHTGDLAKLGLGGGGLATAAGDYSKGSGSGSESSGNLSKFIGMLAFSDRSLKTNIELVRRDPDGLGWYRWNWKSDPQGERQFGVIADEVKELRPWAYVPDYLGSGKAGVNYGTLSQKEAA